MPNERLTAASMPRPDPNYRPIPRVLAQHVEETAFLWHLRAVGVGQPQYDFKSLARLDNRLAGHLDGLRVAGDDGWQFARKELEDHPDRASSLAQPFSRLSPETKPASATC